MHNSDFQFSNPVLVSLNYYINDEFQPKDELIDVQIDFNVNIKKSPHEKNAVVELSLILGTDSENSPFYIKATEGAKFKWISDDQDFIQKLLERNAPALLLGYLRPIIATITSSSPYNAYNIPFIDFTGK